MDSFELEQQIRPELQGDEKLLWVGRPRQGLRFTAGDIIALPFALFWCGFVAVWEWIAIHQNAGWVFVLWGVPFILVGVHLLAGRYISDAYRRSRTFYGLTTRRLVFVMRGSHRKVESVNLAALPQVTLREGANRRGSIVLGPWNPLYEVIASSSRRTSRHALPRLDGIENVRSVYDRLIKAQEELRQPQA